MKTHTLPGLRLLVLPALMLAATAAATEWHTPDAAGTDISFYSNAPAIDVRYAGLGVPRLVCVGSSGEQTRLAPVRLEGDSTSYRFNGIPASTFHRHGSECRLYVPAAATGVTIGVPDGAELVFFDGIDSTDGYAISGSRTTQRPVTQRREPDNYEWRERHNSIVTEARRTQPKALIIGNSITHFWGGVPDCRHKNGSESWEAVMAPAGFMNMGCGWDRIENVLWRIYHGELDGFEAEKIVLMIGTNNMGLSSDDDIVEGLRFLAAAIHARQPKAQIKIVGILPRRGHEDWVRAINPRIAAMAEEEGYAYTDVGAALVTPDGKVDETLFTDGLHPNQKGYTLIAPAIAK